MPVKIYLLFVFFVFFSCSTEKKQEEITAVKPSNKNGEALAKIYCGSCHQFPEPQLLPKHIWKQKVLPNMAQRLGLENDFFKLYYHYDPEEMGIIINAHVYPENPQIAKQDWDKIVKYYVNNAPQEPIKQATKSKVKVGSPNFEVHKIYGNAKTIPSVTALKFNPQDKSIYAGWLVESSFLKKYNTNFVQIDSFNLESPVSQINFERNTLSYLSMGKINPSDKPAGSLVNLTPSNKPKQLINQLLRPVQMSMGDLNADGTQDYLICNFGNETGNLTWYDGKTLKPNLLKQAPGARMSYIADLNHDKMLDIVVLMTQAREGVYVFYNQGNGTFDEKQILEFSSVFGSSYIDLVDFNKDGFLDLVYTNGDNADLSYSLKSYHGIRIFLNDKKGNYTQSYFYPVFGASKALAVDFDSDGDLDIATISFFPNRDQKPNEGFLFLENKGNNQFNVSTVKEAELGKWMVMEVADVDSDGDKDIILGSYLRDGEDDLRAINSKNKNLPAILVLENKILNK